MLNEFANVVFISLSFKILHSISYFLSSIVISNVLMIYSYGLCLAYAEYADEDTNRNESCVKRLEQYQINWNKTKYKEDLTCGNCTR